MLTLTRRELGVLARLDVVAVLAVASARVDSDLLSVAITLALVAWPITIVIPMHWRGELEQGEAIRYSSAFLAAFLGVFVIAYGDAQGTSYPSTGLLFGFGTAHMVAVWIYLRGRVEDLRHYSAWVGASVMFIAGVLADLPGGLGWNAAAFGAYGLASGAAIYRIELIARDRATGSDRPS